jgi:hypothetical protein
VRRRPLRAARCQQSSPSPHRLSSQGPRRTCYARKQQQRGARCTHREGERRLRRLATSPTQQVSPARGHSAARSLPEPPRALCAAAQPRPCARRFRPRARRARSAARRHGGDAGHARSPGRVGGGDGASAGRRDSPHARAGRAAWALPGRNHDGERADAEQDDIALRRHQGAWLSSPARCAGRGARASAARVAFAAFAYKQRVRLRRDLGSAYRARFAAPRGGCRTQRPAAAFPISVAQPAECERPRLRLGFRFPPHAGVRAGHAAHAQRARARPRGLRRQVRRTQSQERARAGPIPHGRC